MATAVRRSLRQLVETVLLAHAIEVGTEAPRKSRRDVSSLVERLPFAREYSTHGGLLLLHRLQAFPPGEPAQQRTLAEAFPTCTDPVADLARAHGLWAKVHGAVRALATSNDAAALAVLDDFEAAHQLLATV